MNDLKQAKKKKKEADKQNNAQALNDYEFNQRK